MIGVLAIMKMRIMPSVQDVVSDGLGQPIKVNEIIIILVLRWRHFSRCAVDRFVPAKDEHVEGSSCRGFVHRVNMTERRIR